MVRKSLTHLAIPLCATFCLFFLFCFVLFCFVLFVFLSFCLTTFWCHLWSVTEITRGNLESICLTVVITLATGICLSKTGPTDPQSSKQRLFTKHEFHYLNVRRVGTLTAHDEFECTLECLKNPLCLSLNTAASRRPDEKFWCELLSSDKHSNAKDYAENMSSHHFSNMVWFPVILSPMFVFCWSWSMTMMKSRPNDRNISMQRIATLLGANCCVRLATLLRCVATSKWTNESINQSMNQWINESMNQWINESMNQWINESMNQWINESMNQWINESMNEWMRFFLYRRTFPNIFWSLPNITEDNRRLPKTSEEDLKKFRLYTDKFKCIYREKNGIFTCADKFDILTCGDIVFINLKSLPLGIPLAFI